MDRKKSQACEFLNICQECAITGSWLCGDELQRPGLSVLSLKRSRAPVSSDSQSRELSPDQSSCRG